MPPVKKKLNFRKRINYFIAVSILLLFFIWLFQQAHVPVTGDEETPAGPGAVTPRTHGLVAEFAEDVPIYTPSKVLTCHIADPVTNAGAVLETTTQILEVAEFYRTALLPNWEVKEEQIPVQSERGELVYLFRGERENRLLVVRLTVDGRGTQIQLKLTPGG